MVCKKRNCKKNRATQPKGGILNKWIKERGGEGLVDDNSYDGSFSETTSASFSADFAIGAVDGGAENEAVTTGYGFQIDLSTSFTGEDSFDVSLDAGNATGPLSGLDINSTYDNALTVDGVSYTFPIGDKTTLFVGDSMDGSTLYSTACVYEGFTDNLDDCGNYKTNLKAYGEGTALGASYDIGNGFTASVGYLGTGGSAGLLTGESNDSYGFQLTYTGDSYGASATYAGLETATALGINGYYEFGDNLPSISVGYEFTENEGAVADQTQWFAGLQWDEIGPGTLGAAIGTKGPQSDGSTEEMAYEAFYSYSLNDSMTITPAIFILENNGSGETDETGVVVKTSFSF